MTETTTSPVSYADPDLQLEADHIARCYDVPPPLPCDMPGMPSYVPWDETPEGQAALAKRARELRLQMVREMAAVDDLPAEDRKRAVRRLIADQRDQAGVYERHGSPVESEQHETAIRILEMDEGGLVAAMRRRRRELTPVREQMTTAEQLLRDLRRGVSLADRALVDDDTSDAMSRLDQIAQVGAGFVHLGEQLLAASRRVGDQVWRST